jgi:succinate dehydrogenase / fumarate reductase, cytochrome b subunit
MAVTGVLLYLFVLVHMLGMLKVFTGSEHFDEYAEFLRRIGDPVLGHSWFLWVQRVGLTVAVVLHIWAAWRTTRASHDARPIKYAQRSNVQASAASRTMRWGGIAIALFVVYHLLHMTTGNVHPDFESGKAYDNLIAGLEVPWVSAVYLLGTAAVALHLYHGTWSVFQTLGYTSPRTDPIIRRFSLISAWAIFLGFAIVPVAILTGVLD